MQSSKELIGGKAIFLAIALTIVLFGGARADVMFVAGDVAGTWSADSIIVTDSIRVPAGETLAIEPGVNVMFLGYFKFEILDGAVLHAVGTEAEPISFISFQEGDRSLGLDFINASNRSILEYCVITDALTSGIHLDNSDITIRNCLIENSDAPTGSIGGGAIELINGSDALIENNILRDNFSADFGGAIYCEASSPMIIGNEITDNIAGYYGTAYGGGIACVDGSSPEIRDNFIARNSVVPTGVFTVNNGLGGGIYLSGGSNAVISGNIITGNISRFGPQTRTYGGGIGVFNADPMISNNVIVNNSAEGNDGGGIYLYNSDSELINNTISYNIAGDFGGAIFADNSNPVIVNSILYFNQDSAGIEIYAEDSNVDVSYSNVAGSFPGEGNIDSDPLYRDPENNDFHLMAIECGDDYNSPAIDAGSPTIVDSYLDCMYGLGAELSDMGAYGGGQGNPTDVTDPADTIIPDLFELSQNYPNPFNGSTTIAFNLSVASDVALEIYDVLGRSVENIDLAGQQPGYHTYTWQADGYPSGTYFYKLRAGDQTETRKMTYLK